MSIVIFPTKNLKKKRLKESAIDFNFIILNYHDIKSVNHKILTKKKTFKSIFYRNRPSRNALVSLFCIKNEKDYDIPNFNLVRKLLA